MQRVRESDTRISMIRISRIWQARVREGMGKGKVEDKDEEGVKGSQWCTCIVS
jgi:hypothetical protein